MSAEQNPASAPTSDPAMLEKENAELKAKVAFLQTKLQLVGSITRHDVLNQMTAIMGYNELLGMMIEDPKLKSFLEKERQAIDKIRRQFQFAKDFQNIAVEPPRWQNLRNLCTRVSEDFDLKGVRIIAETGNLSILADPELDKVFHHIFENALLHGQKTAEITVSLRDNGNGGLLIVENNGVGIPVEEKSKIFERGYGKGTGWGLFLARAILAVTGMTIAETGDPEKGVRFEIRLPAGSFRENGAPPCA
jgi:signal transduction histidine kinase